MDMNKHGHHQNVIDASPMSLGLSTVFIFVCLFSLVSGGTVAFAQTIDDSGETVKIKTNKMKFNGGVWWEIRDGQVKPVLRGELALKDADGMCGRVRMDFYAEGHVLLVTKYGGENACANGNRKQTWSVSQEPYDSNKLNEVKVSIEKKTRNKDWTIIGSKTVKLKTITHKVKITEDGFDFGGHSFALGAPTNSGVVAWSWSSGQVTPRVSGYIHINHAASACARLQITYYSVGGDLLETKAGGKVCASDNSHWYKQVDLSKYSDWKIASIKINLQTLRTDNSWRTVGHRSSQYVFSNDGCESCRYRFVGGKL